MALANVPGTGGKYRADPNGLAAIGRSQDLADASLDVAQHGAALGRKYDPDGTYSAEPRGVRAGWNNEFRAGAAVVQDEPVYPAARRMVMADVLIAMESQRG